MAVGKIKPLPSDAGRHAHDYRLKSEPLNATFDCYARSVLTSDQMSWTERGGQGLQPKLTNGGFCRRATIINFFNNTSAMRA